MMCPIFLYQKREDFGNEKAENDGGNTDLRGGLQQYHLFAAVSACRVSMPDVVGVIFLYTSTVQPSKATSNPSFLTVSSMSACRACP